MAAATSSGAALRRFLRVFPLAAADSGAEAAAVLLLPAAAEACACAGAPLATAAPAGAPAATRVAAVGAASRRWPAVSNLTGFSPVPCTLQLATVSSALRVACRGVLRVSGAEAVRPPAKASCGSLPPVPATDSISSCSLPASSASAAAAAPPFSSSLFSSFPAAAAEYRQQRGYRHWARHRAFEKIRRLPNRALRPGCCAASLFPSPVNSYSTTYSSNRSRSSPPHSSDTNTAMTCDTTTASSRGSCDSPSITGGSALQRDSSMRRPESESSVRTSNENTTSFTGFLSPNITGSMAVHGDYRVARTAGGGYRLVPPYPPRINKTIEPYPPSAPKYFSVNRSYPLQWRNIEYKYVPVRLPRPYGAAAAAAAGGGGAGTIAGQAGAAWGGEIIRIFHKRKGWKKKGK